MRLEESASWLPPFLNAAAKMSCMGLRVSLEVFQQSSLFAARGLGKHPVPRCKCGAQFVPPRLQLSKPLFENGKFFSRQLPNAMTGCASPVLFTENVCQFSHRESDR